MTIVKCFGFDVEAEVLGVLRRVSWDGGDAFLTIEGIDHTTALAIIAALSTGSLKSTVTQTAEAAVAPIGQAVDAVQAARAVGDELTAKAARGRRGRTSAPTPEPAPEDAPVAPAETVAPPTQPKSQDAPAPAAQSAVPTPAEPEPPSADPWALSGTPQTAPQAPAPVAQAAAPTEPAPAAAYDLEMLKRATTVRGVVQHLLEHGFDSRTKLVAICRELKEQVPVLNRMLDMESRLERTCEVLSVGS